MDNLSLIKDTIFEFLLFKPAYFPYLAAYGVLVACGLGLPMPEDITLFVMGYVSYTGIASYRGSVAVCMLGVLCGDSIIYLIGRRYGQTLAKKRLFARVLSPERMEGARKAFHKRGNRVIFFARFMPGLRAPTYFSAGTLKLPYRIFLFYDAMASLLSVPLLIGTTYFFGEQLEHAIAVARKVQNGVALLVLGVVLLFVAKHYIAKRRK